MVINIDKLPEKGLSLSEKFNFLSDDLLDEKAVFLENIKADLFVKKIDEEILIKGSILTRLNLICSRCLIPFEFRVDSSFDLVFYTEEMDIIKDQLEADDMEQFFYYSRKIDLKEIAREQLNLTFPLKPLCSSECQGICPVCGVVIKKSECSCSDRDSDPRFEKLINFMRDKG